MIYLTMYLTIGLIYGTLFSFAMYHSLVGYCAYLLNTDMRGLDSLEYASMLQLQKGAKQESRPDLAGVKPWVAVSYGSLIVITFCWPIYIVWLLKCKTWREFKREYNARRVAASSQIIMEKNGE